MTQAPIPVELLTVLGHYALGELKAVRRTERGFVNDNWIVTTDRGRYFLKRRHPDLRQPSVIRAQHDLIRWLQQRGFPAPAVIPTLKDHTLLILDGDFYEVQSYIEGEAYDHSCVSHLEAASFMLGRYHLCAQGFAPQALCDLGELYNPTLLERVFSQLVAVRTLNQDPDLVPIVRQLRAHLAELTERFAEHGPLPHLVIHGDYYAGNLLFDGNRIIGVVDYDKARWQRRVVELAEALIYFSSPRPGHLKHLVYPGFLLWEPFARFASNYARVAVLEESEIRAVPDYVRCIWMQVSLSRLLERSLPPSEAFEALGEVLELAHWAKANAKLMSETCTPLASNRSS